MLSSLLRLSVIVDHERWDVNRRGSLVLHPWSYAGVSILGWPLARGGGGEDWTPNIWTCAVVYPG